jgi:microcystin-dependent protein
MDDSHQRLEALVALFTADAFSARPAAGASNARGFFLATDTNVLYYSNGTAWFSVNSFSSPIAITPGDSNTDGTSTFAARADHKHSLPAWGAVGDIEATSTTASAGTDVLFARSDHRHTIGVGSVVSGSLAANSISAANLFTAQVVEREAIKDGAINKAKIAAEQQIPSGTIMAFGGTSAPSGWLFCDGESYDLNTYNDLYNVIGVRYGGSGSNFNVPDLRNRVPRGANATNASVSSTSTDAVTIGANNLPVHTHAVGSLSVANHADHVHANSGTISTASLGAHTHQYGHSHGGYVLNGTVGSNGSYGLFYIPTGDGPYSAFFGGEGPQLDLGSAALNNGTITTNTQSTTTTGDSPSLSHSHSISGNTGGVVAPALSHAVSGSTGNNTTTATDLTVVPRHQTVNYIIKT